MQNEWLSPRDLAAEQAVPGGFDLAACVREPIHRLGGVQSYGVLLGVDPDTLLVRVASDNTAAVLGVETRRLIGAPADVLLERAVLEEARETTAGHDGQATVLPVVLEVAGEERDFDLSAHRREGLLVLELEPRPSGPFEFTGFYRGVRTALARLRSTDSVTESCRIAAREIRALTGFDRVVAYRFDGALGPGEVIAESVTDGWEPWLGLWFPATDIPPQARRLYLENWIRVISDVEDVSAGLVPPVLPGTDRPLDLSGAALRTVSGFHLEYLRNIGVRSSMSVSVVRDGTLWGLIACHGADPVYLGPELRAACELFGSAFSLQLDVVEERHRARSLTRARTRMARAAQLLGPVLEGGAEESHAAVAGLLDADGLVVFRDGRATGTPLPAPLLAELVERAALAGVGSVWATDRLAEELDADTAEAMGAAPPEVQQACPAGLLMIPLGGAEFLAWTRAERPVPRAWAADPLQPVRTGPHGERLTPRGSSAVYRETVRGRSRPWSTVDRAVAQELWQLLTDLVLHQAAELGVLNDELRMINLDLDSFAHAAAHDLKEPLRGISNSATFILEDAGGSLDEVTRRRLHTMQRLTGRMDELLNSLLHYARLGRSGLTRTRVALDDVLDSALEIAGPRLAEEGVAVVRPQALPALEADADRLTDILVNLLVNAAKYASPGRADRRVEVAVLRLTPPGAEQPQDTVRVRDNGIGIPADRHEEVFDLFRRLHRPSEHGGGTGVGLAVVKRIVERHGGRLWLDSAPGEGTSFHFTLAPPPGGLTGPAAG
ncbi:ATP-binding protein [Streptomyces sp. NPDC087440]|uniref:ATP-binding protein n=1 Tax=Streptomyces sp. NPDC087440 TaxID=3365790 RepID=UPI00382EBB97